MESYLAYGEDTHTLRLTSELVDLRVGYASSILLRKGAFFLPKSPSKQNGTPIGVPFCFA